MSPVKQSVPYWSCQEHCAGVCWAALSLVSKLVSTSNRHQLIFRLLKRPRSSGIVQLLIIYLETPFLVQAASHVNDVTIPAETSLELVWSASRGCQLVSGSYRLPNIWPCLGLDKSIGICKLASLMGCKSHLVSFLGGFFSILRISKENSRQNIQ